MPEQLQRSLRQLADEGRLNLLGGIRHGVEKEGLRVDLQGRIAQTPHPAALGSALTHPRITTDYSEALLEFITPVHEGIEPMLAELAELHRYSYRYLPDERIWGGSMPCRIDDPAEVVIARYGSSDIGRLKHIYRVGLEHRYGRVMQSIAGIHYNFSLAETLWPELHRYAGAEGSVQAYRSAAYFGLIRNFRRHSWLLIYLFGASPAVSSGFVAPNRRKGLQAHGRETLIAPYATSLRMSDLGYANNAQSSLNVCYNTLENYVHTLSDAVARPYAAYEQIGVKVDGQYRQLNSNLLQIENEYYSDIRPKRVVGSGERPLQAIRERGVEYVEVRNVDINPFLPLGIDAEQARFLDCFLLHCLLTESPWIEGAECDQVKQNLLEVAWNGRKPGLQLKRPQGLDSLKNWALELLEQLQPLAEALDASGGNGAFVQALAAQRGKVDNPDLTPSGQMITALLDQKQEYVALLLMLAEQHRQSLMAEPLSPERLLDLEQLSARSLSEQASLERDCAPDFDAFVADYVSRGLS